MKFPLAVFMALLAFNSYAAEPVAFRPVPAESSIAFEVMQGTAKIAGAFTHFTAQIAFHPEVLDKSSAMVEVNTGAVTISNGEAGSALSKPEWLDITQFPKANFTANGFKLLGGNRYEATGTLTLKGVAVPVTLDFTLLEFSLTQARIMGEATLKRRDFGIGWEDTKAVADEVKVMIAVKAVAP